MPRTARDAFLLTSAKEKFKAFAETNDFDTAREYALLVFAEELPATDDPNKAWGEHCQLVGARRVLQILSSLHIKQEAQKAYKAPQLKPPE